ncbi:MAG TPA: hypothetical protein VJ939_03950, partial [Bacteroidales bacterium]|nr:hypothetical protein [Bacteroidales bacterium]
MNRRWIFLFMVTLALAGCDNTRSPGVPENVRNTLDYSGRNYIEFLEAIVDYRKPEDSLKLQSLYYLIAYMPSHGYRTYLLQDTSGLLIDYNIRDYKNFKRLTEVKDSISLKHGKLHFIRHYYGKDVFIVDSEYMKDLVEESITVWRSNEWSKNYDFEVFKEKILPKRLNSGPFDDWQAIIRDSLLTKLEIKTDNPLEVADAIYHRLRGFLKWDKRYIENPTDQGWQEMKKHRSARTEDAAVLLLAALRSYGIAAAIDFIPLTIESSEYSTYWVVVWDAQGNKRYYYPFGDSLKKPTRFP